ncbi:hypothetical protein PC116_g2354 [Phytophthora cactorum]|uniref:Uncharacterized protein n=1 Tax=Phytophthora cactorum TaxID=29920 RepID=A0A8T1DZZ7_9STRA|nr:hypothetical protein PC114_g6901 [Phytophthora cactorum]KAG2947356.1 hypothetical protein PC117_g6867 [Phytophthora cactorum]KAG3031146.1 hypothetical protein PC120_g3330 [Phytophthora cactorum]KAG3031304.1 hypothetical protein PC119_g5971 [Phytophthora cactorum]KAG4249994.1 hypothetical protein PC116_g2354 [Phytophthora cactorum]
MHSVHRLAPSALCPEALCVDDQEDDLKDEAAPAPCYCRRQHGPPFDSLHGAIAAQ